MNAPLAKRLAVIGIALQGALAVGYVIAGALMSEMLVDIPQDGAISGVMAHTTGGVANALLAIVVVKPIGLVGLVLMTIALVVGKLRERWVFKWAIVCMSLWTVMVGVGTIIGIAGLILLYINRKCFRPEEGGANPSAIVEPP